MIPLRDSEATNRLTAGNTLLILANAVVFVLEMQMGRRVNLLIGHYALIPSHLAHLRLSAPRHAMIILSTIFTSTFLHAGFLHIAGNMLYLFIFGPAVEERMGTIRYLLFYLAAGAAAGLAMVAMGPYSLVAVIGASGAIAGVLGAYFVLYPRGRITTIVPLVLFWPIVEIRAYFYLLFWFVAQLYAGIGADASGPMVGGVAWWAHVGGFLFGIAMGPLLARTLPASARRARRA